MLMMIALLLLAQSLYLASKSRVERGIGQEFEGIVLRRYLGGTYAGVPYETTTAVY